MVEIILWLLIIFNTFMWVCCFYYEPIPQLNRSKISMENAILQMQRSIEKLERDKQNKPTRDWLPGNKHEHGHNYD